MTQPTPTPADTFLDAVRGPWVAVLADRYGWLVSPDDIDEEWADGVTVQIVRRSAAPGARSDGEGNRLPGTYLSADHLVTFDDFEEPEELWSLWVQAQAMVAGLNAAAEAVPTLPPALAEAAEWFMAQYTNRVSPAALLAMAFIEGYAAGRATPLTDATEPAVRDAQTGDET